MYVDPSLIWEEGMHGLDIMMLHYNRLILTTMLAADSLRDYGYLHST